MLRIFLPPPRVHTLSFLVILLWRDPPTRPREKENDLPRKYVEPGQMALRVEKDGRSDDLGV